jgi:hypothetical protein
VRQLSTPVAILIGSGVIGASVYLGLRARSQPAAIDVTQATSTSAQAASTSTQGPALSTPPPTAQPASADTVSGVRAQIDAQHAHLVETCWAQSPTRDQNPPKVTLTLMLEYGDDGSLSVRSLHMDRSMGHADVSQCVGRELVSPKQIAPGHRVRVNVPISLP